MHSSTRCLSYCETLRAPATGLREILEKFPDTEEQCRKLVIRGLWNLVFDTGFFSQAAMTLQRQRERERQRIDFDNAPELQSDTDDVFQMYRRSLGTNVTHAENVGTEGRGKSTLSPINSGARTFDATRHRTAIQSSAARPQPSGLPSIDIDGFTYDLVPV